MIDSPCSHLSLVVLLSAFALLSACGKDRAPAVAAAPTAKPAAAARSDKAPAKPAPARTVGAAPVVVPARASTAFRVTAVTLGHEVNAAREITQPGNRFTANEKILYASVVTSGVTAGATLNARWNYLESTGQLITSVTQRIATNGLATTTFTLQNPDLWPEGKYNVEIWVDGKLANTQGFTIGKAVP